MENKVCSYTEPNVRLQLVRVQEGTSLRFEIRFNRRVIRIFGTGPNEAIFSRLIFSHYVSMICVDRNSSSLLKMTW